MSKPFGYSYLLDMGGCKPGVCDDLETIYRFLENLCEKIGMTPMAPVYVLHGPRKNGVEVFPDKAGVSGVQFLIESAIVLHAMEPTHFITLDVYSCGCFDPEIVKQYAQETFEFTEGESHFIERGTKYPRKDS